jgi:platelet-activating factor acetylhydrolase IB subunit alpha
VYRRLSILDYFRNNNLESSFEALKAEAGLGESYVGDGRQRYSGLLEKKWNSVIRLQKKVSSTFGDIIGHFRQTFQ